MNIENHRAHRVRHELRFINEHEKASVTDFFIPGHRAKPQLSVLSVSSVVDYPGIFPYKKYETDAAIGKQPVSQSEYELTCVLPENLISSLPGIEELEAELGGMED